MKNIVIAALMCVFGFSTADAQTIKLYKDNTLVATYKSSEVNRIVFEKEEETPVTPVTPDTGDHEYVDLGLTSGTLWAKTNIGAEKETDYGMYFAWGETTGYTSDTSDGHSFAWANYSLCNGSYDTQTKYCTSSSYGTVDNNTELEAADDAATANWGSKWQMPSNAQQDELRTECTWTWDSTNKGYKVTGTNGNSIFLPAAGCRDSGGFGNAGSYGYYWSRFLYSSSSYGAYGLFFDSSDVDWGNYRRYYGQSVRAVRVSE